MLTFPFYGRMSGGMHGGSHNVIVYSIGTNPPGAMIQYDYDNPARPEPIQFVSFINQYGQADVAITPRDVAKENAELEETRSRMRRERDELVRHALGVSCTSEEQIAAVAELKRRLDLK